MTTHQGFIDELNELKAEQATVTNRRKKADRLRFESRDRLGYLARSIHRDGTLERWIKVSVGAAVLTEAAHHNGLEAEEVWASGEAAWVVIRQAYDPETAEKWR